MEDLYPRIPFCKTNLDLEPEKQKKYVGKTLIVISTSFDIDYSFNPIYISFHTDNNPASLLYLPKFTGFLHLIQPKK